MKKYFILIVVLIITLFTSCQEIYNICADTYYYDLFEGKKLYYLPEFEELKNLHEIAHWIKDNVKYEKNTDINGEHVSNPEETLRRGYGDCDDLAVLFANIAYFALGVKMDIILVRTGSKRGAEDIDSFEFYVVAEGSYNSEARTIEEGGLVNHAMVRIDNSQIEPQSGFERTRNIEVGYYYTFNTVFTL